MSPKLPVSLRYQTPYLVGEWLIWADSESRAVELYREIDLRESFRPGLSCGALRYMDSRTLKFFTSHYVKEEDYLRVDVWETN